MLSVLMAHHQLNLTNVKFEEVLCKIPTTSVLHREVERFVVVREFTEFCLHFVQNYLEIFNQSMQYL